MVEQDELGQRESLLAFLEAHWGTLTLREARSLVLEGSQANAHRDVSPQVKDALISP
jgi:hypothetical protein